MTDTDLEKFWQAVREMREAQKLEWAVLPSNFRAWKRARAQQNVSRLEQNVDALMLEILREQGWTDEGKGQDPKGLAM